MLRAEQMGAFWEEPPTSPVASRHSMPTMTIRWKLGEGLSKWASMGRVEQPTWSLQGLEDQSIGVQLTLFEASWTVCDRLMSSQRAASCLYPPSSEQASALGTEDEI